MIQRSLVTLAILFLGAGVASAQGLAHWRSAKKDVEARRVRSILNPSEVAYLDELSLILGAADESGPVELAYGPDALQAQPRGEPRPVGARLARARGVWTKVGGLEVLRFRFPSEGHAQRFAIYAAETEGHPTLLEVRGKQLVIARGERLRDPAELKRIRSAAWSVLPHAPGAPSVAGLTLSRAEHAYELRIPNADLDSLIDGAFEESEDSPHSGDVNEGHSLAQRWDGHASQVVRYDDRKTLWVASGRAAQGQPKIKALASELFATSQRLAEAAEEKKNLATRPRPRLRGYQTRGYQTRRYQTRGYQTRSYQTRKPRVPSQRLEPAEPAEAKPRVRRDGIRDALKRRDRLERIQRAQELLRRLEPKRLTLQ